MAEIIVRYSLALRHAEKAAEARRIEFTVPKMQLSSHSARNVSTGSSLAARRAGKYADSDTAVNRTPSTPA
jgi:hypothetical protein